MTCGASVRPGGFGQGARPLLSQGAPPSFLLHERVPEAGQIALVPAEPPGLGVQADGFRFSRGAGGAEGGGQVVQPGHRVRTRHPAEAGRGQGAGAGRGRHTGAGQDRAGHGRAGPGHGQRLGQGGVLAEDRIGDVRGHQPSDQVTHAGADDGQLAVQLVHGFLGRLGLGVRPLLLVMGDAPGLDLRWLGVVERAAHGARRIIGQPSDQLGDHAVETFLANALRDLA